MSGIDVDPTDHTISATRSLRSAGSSLTLTIPPALLDAIAAGEGDELRLVANMDTGVIEVAKTDENEE